MLELLKAYDVQLQFDKEECLAKHNRSANGCLGRVLGTWANYFPDHARLLFTVEAFNAKPC